MRASTGANGVRTKQTSIRLTMQADELATALARRMNEAGRYSGLAITKAKLLALAVTRGLSVIADELKETKK